jgi:phage antirepressor YoqD-like protein
MPATTADTDCKYSADYVAQWLRMTKRQLLAWMKAHQVIDQHRVVYHKYAKLGYFKTEYTSFTPPSTGITRQTAKVKISKAGYAWLREQMKQENAA